MIQIDVYKRQINNGGITVISTDHAPHTIEEKNKPIDKAPFGIIGNQHALSLIHI